MTRFSDFTDGELKVFDRALVCLAQFVRDGRFVYNDEQRDDHTGVREELDREIESRGEDA